jgi:hypothetical protein
MNQQFLLANLFEDFSPVYQSKTLLESLNLLSWFEKKGLQPQLRLRRQGF